MTKDLKNQIFEFKRQYSLAAESKNWDFLKEPDITVLHKLDMEIIEAMGRYWWPNLLEDLHRKIIDVAVPIKKYLDSCERFGKKYPEWFAVRNGKALDECLFSHLDKFKFRKKFLHPLKFEDVAIKWLLALQMLGCAVWKDITTFAQERRNGMCAELDVRESMTGAEWMEIVGEDEFRGKKRLIYSLTDVGADVIQYCAEH